jgi:hypothetical protein
MPQSAESTYSTQPASYGDQHAPISSQSSFLSGLSDVSLASSSPSPVTPTLSRRDKKGRAAVLPGSP